MLLDLEFVVDWHDLVRRQQVKINKANLRENLRRFKYDYEIGDKILIKKYINDNII